MEVIAETPDTLEGVLWQYLRHLRDWQDARPFRRGELIVPDRRGELFNPDHPAWVLAKRRHAAASVPELRTALDTFDGVIRAPLTASEITTADACETVVSWARGQGFVETAIQFAELAAIVDGREPRRANLAGKLTREAGDYPRAEVWFERGIGLARLRRDWVEYIRGHLGAGIMYMAQGKESRAQKHFNTASTIAMREGHEWLAAEAQHDLFHFMTVRGRYVEGELHARRALAWYPKHHARFPFFAADVAFLLVCEHHFAPAVDLLRRFVRTIKPPHNLLGLSLFVRALASAGKVHEFRRRREHLLRLLDKHKTYEAAARWNLAHGERAAGMWEAATANARSALEIAHAERDDETEGLVRVLLAELEAGTAGPTEIHRTDKAFRDLLHALHERLSEWAPTRRGRSPSRSRPDWAA